MAKVFNVTAVCRPEQHYMVNIDDKLKEIRQLVDSGMYFTINRARQYGKTTTLRALNQYLQNDYYVVLLDFQTFDKSTFQDGHIFSVSFADSFLRKFKRNKSLINNELQKELDYLKKDMDNSDILTMKKLFERISDICAVSDKPIVLMIDEVDSASNNQVFLDFLAQLRAGYIDRDETPAFQSVILAGVYDIKNIKRKLRPEEEHKVNSPWNIAADFTVDMSLSKKGIAEMLKDYEKDYHTGMDINEISCFIYEYTSGYPFLVSRLCKLMDEQIAGTEAFGEKNTVWTKEGVLEAVKILLSEKNPLFESLIGKLNDYPELKKLIYQLLFHGQAIAYNADEPATDMLLMFGFAKVENQMVQIANRIFETRLYNYFLTLPEVQNGSIYKLALLGKSQFTQNGCLDMKHILEKFTEHFDDIYGDQDEKFLEEDGRRYFMLYLKPIINGVGNYYIESRTRNQERTDLIVDYLGMQYIIEMKIWRGTAYNERGEEQLGSYLDYYHLKKGYMLSFNFNKKKEIGIKEIRIGDKILIEAVV